MCECNECLCGLDGVDHLGCKDTLETSLLAERVDGVLMRIENLILVLVY